MPRVARDVVEWSSASSFGPRCHWVARYIVERPTMSLNDPPCRQTAFRFVEWPPRRQLGRRVIEWPSVLSNGPPYCWMTLCVVEQPSVCISSYHLHDAFTVVTVGHLQQLPEMNEAIFVSFRGLFHFCFIPTSFSFCFIYCFILMILFHSFRATISFLYQSPSYGKWLCNQSKKL